MTADMAPPPPKDPNPSSSGEPVATESQTLGEPSASEPARNSMPPPPPKTTKPLEVESADPQKDTLQEPQSIPNQDEPEPVKIADRDPTIEKSDHPKPEQQRPSTAVPYTIPEWSGPPSHNYSLEVLKEGSIIDQLNVHEKGAYMFGRVDLCDFMLEHPTVSRFHAVLQFKRSGNAFLYDLGSTHGSFVNKNQVKKRVYVELHVGDVIRFGHSSRLYILQGPSELMLPERDLNRVRSAKKRAELQDMEASLLRAKVEAARADGISWGMGEDAEEEIEDDLDEVTWQNYKGQLTEKQEKTRDKVIKRLEKIANMKKEIDAIRVKDISQGGLTQGQQTQIARNEQRTAQIMEELENLEETLNESIRESLGARSGKVPRPKKNGATQDDEEDYMSEEDDFYDRTKPKVSKRKDGGDQSVETADTLLDKKEAIVTEMEEKKKLLLDEEKRLASKNEVPADTGDALDAYMSGLSCQLVVDTTEKLQKELSTLQSELDRILYLLKIADPSGEASRKRESKSLDPAEPSPSKLCDDAKAVKEIPSKANKIVKKPEIVVNTDTVVEPVKQEASKVVVDASEKKATVYTVVKPQWLGAVQNTTEETPKEIQLVDVQDEEEVDHFVDYKDRKEALRGDAAAEVNAESGGIENAAPGLIIRKRKQADKASVSENDAATCSKQSTFTPVDTGISAVDAVALLLKHKKGYHVVAEDDEAAQNLETETQSAKGNTKKAKRLLGPERPSFLNKDETDYETWVPPAGQSGDGRTSLNDRYGY